MSYKLEKPYTLDQRADFIVEHNHNNGRNIEETEDALYALEVNEIMVDNEPQADPDYEEKQKQKEEKEFNRKFFNTSLGYVSRDVHMQNGVVKDFLTDILPLLQVGIPVLTYTRQLKQNRVLCTEEFLNECKNQLIVDFYGKYL